MPGVNRYAEMLIENEVTVDALAYFDSDDYKELGIAKGCSIKIKAQLKKAPWCNLVDKPKAA
jgi:formylmethanofuran dehydrogenase subunit D